MAVSLCAFAQDGTRTATKTVNLTVSTYANVTMSGTPAISVTDGGQAGSYTATGGTTFSVICNVTVTAVASVSNSTLTGGVVGNATVGADRVPANNTKTINAGTSTNNAVDIWANGFTLTNSRANDGKAFDVTITLTEN